MDVPEHELPLEWEERWRREKEKHKKGIEDSKEGVEQTDQELKWIAARNDSRTGLRSRFTAEQRSELFGKGNCFREPAEHFIEESPENEDPVHIYCSGSFPEDIFQVLKEFWRSSMLTDLTLVVNNGKSFQVHSVVLAAVSSFIRDSIKKQSNNHTNDDMRTLSLDPEVHHVGLQAVLEFAYTGSVCPLSSDSRGLVNTAARALGVPRLLDLCGKDEKGMEEATPRKEDENKEMKVTLESIKDLWTERAGCDVVLDVDGALFHG